MASLLVVAIALGLAILQALDRDVTTTVPNSHLVFDRPNSWQEADRERILDPSWAAEQKQRYPQDGPLIDAMVDGFRDGRIQYFASIELDGDPLNVDGWVATSAFRREVTAAGLAADARASVNRQPVNVLDATALDVTLPLGPAVRLDWSYDTMRADETLQVVYVRAYWIVDGPSVVAVQLVTYGARPEVVASFDAVAATFQWAPGSGQPLSSAAERWQSGRMRRS
jgi:hypothetical protein